MIQAATYYDVFLSFSLADATVGGRIEAALTQSGIDVFVPWNIPHGGDVSDAIRSALSVADAVVFVPPSNGSIPANMAVELGAAMAWSKPVFVIKPETDCTSLHMQFAPYPAYPISRIDDVIAEIKRGPKPLSRENQDLLMQVYTELHAPTERLLADPSLQDDLVRMFRSRSGARVNGDRLILELLRLRKQGATGNTKRSRRS